MDITQTVNISGYSASVCNKIKSVSQVKKTEEVKELSEEEKLVEFKKEIWKLRVTSQNENHRIRK